MGHGDTDKYKWSAKQKALIKQAKHLHAQRISEQPLSVDEMNRLLLFMEQTGASFMPHGLLCEYEYEHSNGLSRVFEFDPETRRLVRITKMIGERHEVKEISYTQGAVSVNAKRYQIKGKSLHGKRRSYALVNAQALTWTTPSATRLATFYDDGVVESLTDSYTTHFVEWSPEKEIERPPGFYVNELGAREGDRVQMTQRNGFQTTYQFGARDKRGNITKVRFSFLGNSIEITYRYQYCDS